MAKRKIITIDQKKCNGCGECKPNCPEGAIQIIDGKARLISDIFCDGLGACLGHCPQGAISAEEREAEPYDERRVMKNIVKQGKNTIIAHLQHLKEHGETDYLNEALEYLQEHDIEVEFNTKTETDTFQPQGCPGSQSITIKQEDTSQQTQQSQPSQLRQWPVQMHLISPDANYFKQSNLLLAADCVAYSIGDFHQRFLSGKTLAIACPKLDSNKDVYLQKLIKLIDEAKINTITVVTMQVPCCTGLLLLAKKTVEGATRKIPLKHIMVSIKGEILKDEWI
jgi:Pyruvate/2-oxoacid:ferredoxin oxidoreductase delta subunit